MPTQSDLNDLSQLSLVQNQAQLSKLSVYFALNQVAYLAQHQPFGDLFGEKPWQANMGPTMQGVRIEPTPKTRTFFRPNTIQQRALKDVMDQREAQERASVYWHKYHSPLIYFLRNWQDYISNQVRPAMSDLNEQVEFGNERFIETVMFDRSANIYVAGDVANGPLQKVADSGPPNYTAIPKSAALIANLIANVRAGATMATVDNAFLALREEQRAVPFAGGNSGIPKDDDLIQGKYIWLTSVEQYSQLKWDPAWQRFRDTDKDYITNKYMGGLFGMCLIRGLSSPIRFDANGNAVAPEVLVEETGEPIPNPQYAKLATAPVELNWMVGGGPSYSTVKIGPPPKEFSGGASARQINGMQWNGKVNITDQVLLSGTDPVTGSTVYEFNSDKEYIQLRATLTMGCLPGRPRNALPMLVLRRRVSEAP